MAQTISQLGVTEAQIAERAYERWIARGCPISDGADDWFAARMELEGELAKPKRKSAKPKAPRKTTARKHDAMASL